MSLNEQLFNAICQGDSITVTQLLQWGADINARYGYFDETPLLAALERQHWDIAKLLIEMGADSNLRASSVVRETAIEIAADLDKRDIIDLLLQKRAHINVRNGFGHTALMSAAQQGHKAMVMHLLNAHADSAIEGCFEKTATDLAGTEEIKQIIIDHRQFMTRQREDNKRVHAVVALRSLANTPLSLMPNELLFIILGMAFPDVDKSMWAWHADSTKSK
jgi:ankyrin repeat protein